MLGAPHHWFVTRFRVLAAILACLAALAGVAGTAAAAGKSFSTDARTMAATPCCDCDDCGTAPCPMPMSDCIQMHAPSGPALLAKATDSGVGGYVTIRWSPDDDFLSGLSPPPDPLPPRA